MLKTTTLVFCSALISYNLHGQAIPPLTSSVNGTVWQDTKPSDGIRSPSEKPIPGILVKLVDAATQNVISTALSSANGEFSLKAEAGTYLVEYVYPSDGFTVSAQRAGSDNTVNSAADDSNFSQEFTIGANENLNEFGLGLVAKQNTLTFCTQKGTTVTEWNDALLLPKSSVAAIPLNVKLFAAESVYHPIIGVENTGTANAYSITTSGKITMTMPINPSSLTMNSDVSIEGDLADFDGTEDYEGASGQTFYNRFSFANVYPARNTSSATLIASNFVGAENETFSIPTKAQSTVSFTGAGNLKTQVQTYVSAGACVVYTYQEGALPVKLASFDARKEGPVVNLTWSTTEEMGSDRFEIQRSSDGKMWSEIGEVSASGTTTQTNMYHFTDASPLAGQNFYRLKMVDLDYTFAYSSIKEASFKSSVNIYPNPASAHIQLQGANADKISKLSIYNQAGQLLKQVTGKAMLDVSSLATGIYSVQTQYVGGESTSTKLLIAR